MRIDISLLPALAAAFMLVFARIGAMVMLLPGLGESNIPVRVKLAIALLLTLVILPLHRSAYHVDMQSMIPMLVLMVHEIVIGIVLGATARMGGTHARPPGTLTRNGKYAAISTGAEKPIRAVLRKAVSDAPAKTANRIQCDSLTFLHERTSTSAAA